MQPIFLESLRIGQHAKKILELDSIPIAPSNSSKLPHVLTGHRQGRPIPPILRAYNLSSTQLNEMTLIGNEIWFSYLYNDIRFTQIQ